MNISDLKEIKKHGLDGFPVALYKSNYTIPYQWHDEEEIIYITEGRADYNINGETVSLKSGDCSYCHGNILHSMFLDKSRNVTFYALVFDKNYIFSHDDICGNYMKRLSVNSHFKRDNPIDKEIIAIVRDTCEIMVEKPFGYEFAVKSQLAKMYSAILSKGLYYTSDTSENNFYDKTAASVIGYIHSNFDKKITAAELAAIAGYSLPYFESFFKSYTGKSPIDYLVLYRLQAARKLILKTNRSVTDIAYECGFHNISYFIRRFKAVYGLTPHQYRSKNL